MKTQLEKLTSQVGETPDTAEPPDSVFAEETSVSASSQPEESETQLQKVTKTKSVFPTDDSLLKMPYLEMADITRKWTGEGRTGV